MYVPDGVNSVGPWRLSDHFNLSRGNEEGIIQKSTVTVATALFDSHNDPQHTYIHYTFNCKIAVTNRDFIVQYHAIYKKLENG